MRALILMLVLLATPALARDGDATSRFLTANSLDGRYRAEVATMRPVYCGPDGLGSSDNRQHVLEVTEVQTGHKNFAFVGTRGIRLYTDDPAHPSYQWPSEVVFASPKFSLDGKSVYVVMRDTGCDTQSWKDNPRVYRVDYAVGVEHFIVKGRLLAILRTGPRAGHLLVQRQGTDGSGDPVLLVSPDGKTASVIPGSDRTGRRAIKPWLRAQGWTSY